MKVRGLPVIFAGGVVFGVGLAISNMVEQEVVLAFLQLRDMGLAVTMGAALLVAVPVYQLAPRRRPAPPLGPAWDRHPRRVTARHLCGGAIFGVGWGLSGICPGSAIASLGTGNWPILAGIAGMLAGAWAQGALFPEPATAPPAQAPPLAPAQR
jgi:uncharacterized membrane protein YedE/YeeE